MSLSNKLKVTQAIEQFENEFPQWARFEVLSGFGDDKMSLRIYDSKEDKYVDLRRAKQFIKDFNSVLGQNDMYCAATTVDRKQKNQWSFRVHDTFSQVESGYEDIESDLLDKYGDKIHRLSITENRENGLPFIRFYYKGIPSDETKSEIYNYITTTYQEGGTN